MKTEKVINTKFSCDHEEQICTAKSTFELAVYFPIERKKEGLKLQYAI